VTPAMVTVFFVLDVPPPKVAGQQFPEMELAKFFTRADADAHTPRLSS
jgi:hypothetical protein